MLPQLGSRYICLGLKECLSLFIFPLLFPPPRYIANAESREGFEYPFVDLKFESQ